MTLLRFHRASGDTLPSLPFNAGSQGQRWLDVRSNNIHVLTQRTRATLNLADIILGIKRWGEAEQWENRRIVALGGDWIFDLATGSSRTRAIKHCLHLNDDKH